MHGVNGEVYWDVGGGEGSCGKRYGGCGERTCREMCWEVRKDEWGVEKCGEGCVWGEWKSVLACGERMWGEEWGRCKEEC